MRRRVVVTGASSGIGAATAEHYYRRGDHVLAIDMRPAPPYATESAVCDLRDPQQIADVLASIGGDWDLLAHVAGIPGTAPALDVLLVNYLGMRLFTEGMLPLLRPGGAMVVVASTAGVGWEQRTAVLEGLLESRDRDTVQQWLTTQDSSYPIYSTSKQAAILYAKRLAATAWTRYGVRVNSVSPGPVETPILADFELTMGKEILDAVRESVGRHATVDDIVPAIDFLGSPQSGWIIGQDLHVDGGFMSSLTSGPATISVAESHT